MFTLKEIDKINYNENYKITHCQLYQDYLGMCDNMGIFKLVNLNDTLKMYQLAYTTTNLIIDSQWNSFSFVPHEKHPLDIVFILAHSNKIYYCVDLQKVYEFGKFENDFVTCICSSVDGMYSLQ